MPISCTRRLQFCAGHRLVKHESKCAQPHGHNYVVEISCEGSLDNVGRVIDFSVIKKLVGDWIEENWDHGFILNVQDKEMIQMFKQLGEQNLPVKFHLMDVNPTAENMAEYLYEIAQYLLQPYEIQVNKIRLWETENCDATYEPTKEIS